MEKMFKGWTMRKRILVVESVCLFLSLFVSSGALAAKSVNLVNYFEGRSHSPIGPEKPGLDFAELRDQDLVIPDNFGCREMRYKHPSLSSSDLSEIPTPIYSKWKQELEFYIENELVGAYSSKAYTGSISYNGFDAYTLLKLARKYPAFQAQDVGWQPAPFASAAGKERISREMDINGDGLEDLVRVSSRNHPYFGFAGLVEASFLKSIVDLSDSKKSTLTEFEKKQLLAMAHIGAKIQDWPRGINSGSLVKNYWLWPEWIAYSANKKLQQFPHRQSPCHTGFPLKPFCTNRDIGYYEFYEKGVKWQTNFHYKDMIDLFHGAENLPLVDPQHSCFKDSDITALRIAESFLKERLRGQATADRGTQFYLPPHLTNGTPIVVNFGRAEKDKNKFWMKPLLLSGPKSGVLFFYDLNGKTLVYERPGYNGAPQLHIPASEMLSNEIVVWELPGLHGTNVDTFDRQIDPIQLTIKDRFKVTGSPGPEFFLINIKFKAPKKVLLEWTNPHHERPSDIVIQERTIKANGRF